jgi:hypothetical protein
MAPNSATIDILFSHEDAGWRLYVAPFSRVEALRECSGPRGVIFPVPAPDFVDLERRMWEADAPYEKHPTRDGRAVQLVARGRSARSLLDWLAVLLVDVPRATAND